MLSDLAISRQIFSNFAQKFSTHLDLDVALVGAGPSNLVAGYYLGLKGIKAAIFESKLAPGGGMWGGGMMFNEIVVQQGAKEVLDELLIPHRPGEKGYYVLDSVLATSYLIYKCISAGTSIFNLVKVVDVLFREVDGSPKVSGVVINWSPVESLGLHVDPLGVMAKAVVDGTGHPAEVCNVVSSKLGVQLNTPTGKVVGELPLWAEKGEEFTVENTKEVYPGLFAGGMAANNAFGGPRMGPIFGGMLLSGKKLSGLLEQYIKSAQG